MFKKLIVNLLYLFKFDLWLSRLLGLLSDVKVKRYKAKYGDNFNYVDQGPGGFQISGDPNSFSMGIGSHIKSGTFIECSGGVSIGRYFHTGRGLTIFSTSHNWKSETKIPYDEVSINKPVKIGDFVWFGANVTILPGAHIGDGVVVSAGAVVRGTIPELAIIAGNPAIVIGYRDKEMYLNLLQKKCFF